MHTRPIPFEQRAALHDAARHRAEELRREAIAVLLSQLGRWVARNARRLLPARRSTPCHS